MTARKATKKGGLARAVPEGSVLADFASPFPNLLGKERGEIARSFEKLAGALARSDRKGAIQFTIREGRKTRRWCLTLTPGDCHVAEAEVGHPDLEILTDAEMWAEIASGEISPLEAFGSGRVRVRGDIELARVLAKRARR